MEDMTGSGRRRGGGQADGPAVVEGVVTSVVSEATKTAPRAARKKPAPPTDTIRAARRRAATIRASTVTAAKGVPDVIVPLRYRHDGWTPIRQRTFLRALAELGSVTDACKRAGMSKTSAERLRKQSAEFAAAWDKAVSIVAPILEQAAYERGVEGWDEPIFHGGVQVGVKRRFSDAMLRMLMQNRSRSEETGIVVPDLATASREELEAFAREAAKRADGLFYTRTNQAEMDKALMKRLDAMAERSRRDAAARGLVWLNGGAYPADITVAEAKDYRDRR